MNAEKNQNKVNTQISSIEKSLNQLNLNQDNKVKKQKSLNWNKSINNNKSAKLKLTVAEPLNLSNYTLKKKQTEINFHKSDSLNLSQSIAISSESSTGASINNFTLNFDKKQEKNDLYLEKPLEVTINNNNSYISGSNLYDSLVCRQTFYLERKNSVEEIEEMPLENMSMMEGIKTVDEMGFVLQEGTCQNNSEEEYIWDNSIKIVSFISQGAQAKVYLGLVMETESYVAIKRYLINYNESELQRILEECEIIKSIDHPNIIKYFDIEYVILEQELGEEYSLDKIQNKMMTRIDLIMEYLDGMSLKDFVLKFVKENNSGLPRDKVKYITKCILEGLKHLHENKVIHRDLKPENVIVSEDLEEIKIVDFGISTKVKNCETFCKRTLLGTAYYMAPEVISEKPYAYEADIWSLGCIVYELVSGVKPYANLNPVNAMYSMVQYASPLEYADEKTQDIFYDKSNRMLLDFLNKCWRPNNSFRPSAVEMLSHPFLN